MDQVACRVCKYCSKEFNNRSNFNRHLKNVHKRNTRGELIPEIKKRVFPCPLCNKTYATKYRLDCHTKCVHHHSQDDKNKYKCNFCEFSSFFRYNLIRHEKKVHVDGNNSINEKRIWACSLCNSKFSKVFSLRRHERLKHNVFKETCSDNRICPICLFASSHVKKNHIYNHFESAHGILMTWTHYTFNCIADFYKWKLEIEKKTTSSFVKKFCGTITTAYGCHRSGQFKSKGMNKRKTKTSGSCKINGYCPAAINVKTTNDGVEVMYQSTHVGHTNEVKHKKLSVEERKAVRNQIAGGVQIENDLNVVPVSIANDDLRLMYLAKKNEIYNIEQNINFEEEIIKYPINPRTVQSWINSMRLSSDTEMLMFKPHGVTDNANSFLNKDCFFLTFMTKTQKLLLQKYGLGTVILEHTQSGKIHLSSLLILDECSEGFPIAFMFTDKFDVNTISLFLEKVKCSVRQIKPSVFISGTNNLCYSAWIKVIGVPKTRLFITSHVLAEWKYHLDLECRPQEKRNSVFKMLESLTYDLDIAHFTKSLEETMETLRTEIDTKSFFEYFKEHFINNEKYKCWAYCHWVNVGVNPNVSTKNYNWLLTLLNLQGEVIKPLKLTLCAVIYLLKDKLIQLLIKVKNKTFLENLRLLRFRHLESLKFDTTNVKRHEDRWHVTIPRRKGYSVVKRVGTCRYCKQLMCTLCNVCFHEYVCTCKDYVLKKNMCKHIHLVAQALIKEEKNEIGAGNKVLGFVADEIHSLEDMRDESNPDIQLVGFVNNENHLFGTSTKNCAVISDCNIREDGTVIMNMNFTNNHDIIIEEDILKLEQESSIMEKKIMMSQELETLNTFLQENIVTIEQVDYVRKEIKRIMTTVEAMQLAL